jgi:hypothetical protein
VHRADLHFAHQLVWQIKGRLHFKPDSQKSGFLSNRQLGSAKKLR